MKDYDIALMNKLYWWWFTDRWPEPILIKAIHSATLLA